MTASTEYDGDELVPDGVARDFVRALRRVEDDGDLDEMVGLFGDDAELFRIGHPANQVGADGARRFWDAHRSAAAEISSRFTRATATDDRVVLEWSARARLHDDRSVTVDGVSILDLDDGGLAGFRTYYDTAAFLTRPAADVAT